MNVFEKLVFTLGGTLGTGLSRRVVSFSVIVAEGTEEDILRWLLLLKLLNFDDRD